MGGELQDVALIHAAHPVGGGLGGLTGLGDGFTEFVARSIIGIADRPFHRSVRGKDGD